MAGDDVGSSRYPSRTWGRRYGKLAAVGGLVLVCFVPSLVKGALKLRDPVPPGYAAQNPEGAFAALKWNDLHRGLWPPGGKPSVPKAVADLDGQPVHVRGFMLPLHDAVVASEFFLASQPGACYFCSPPGVADIVMLISPGGRKLPLTDKPVEAFGTLRVATGGPQDQALYVIENTVFVMKRSVIELPGQ